MKTACILLRSGAEISVKTDTIRIRRGLFGRIKAIDVSPDGGQFLQYLSMRDVLAVLVYDGERPAGDGQ